MMNAQTFMILQMNGFNLTCPVHNYYPIFTLLSACEEGISILHQVLDFHKGNFVKHITVELMYTPCNIFTPRLTNFQKLKKSAEGKLLLERLKAFGWTPLTSQNLHAFFGNEAILELSDSEEDPYIKNPLLSSDPWKPN